jgi:hypothetical protein
MKKDQKTFGLLLAAYLISIIYQYYRFTRHEHPADTFGVTEIVSYALLLSWSALSLLNKKWAVWAIVALCTVQLAIGFFYYFPVVFRERHDSFWDWAEALVFVVLIALAGLRAVSQLAGFRRKYSYG